MVPVDGHQILPVNLCTIQPPVAVLVRPRACSDLNVEGSRQKTLESRNSISNAGCLERCGFRVRQSYRRLRPKTCTRSGVCVPPPFDEWPNLPIRLAIPTLWA